MKKILFFLVISLLTGCVDNDFDLSKVDDSDIVIGNEFVAPIGSIKLKYSEITGGVSTPGEGAIELPVTFEQTYPLESGFDSGILDQIAESGSQSVIIKVKHKLPDTQFDLKLSFEQTGVIYEGATDGTIQVDVSKELLAQIAASKSIVIEFTTSGERNVNVNLQDAIDIDLILYRTGGIKL